MRAEDEVERDIYVWLKLDNRNRQTPLKQHKMFLQHATHMRELVSRTLVLMYQIYKDTMYTYNL